MKSRPSIFSGSAAAAALLLLPGCTVTPEPSNMGFAGGGAGGTGNVGGQLTGGLSGGGTGAGAGLAGQASGGAGGFAGFAGSAGASGSAAAGGGSGGASGSGGIPPPAPTFDNFKFIIRASMPPCSSSDCHGGTHPNLLLLVVDDGLHGRLTSYVSEACGNIPVVTPGDPTRSALVKVLRGPCTERMGEPIPRMPNGCIEDEFGNTCIPDDYIAAIEQWIQMGAPP